MTTGDDASTPPPRPSRRGFWSRVGQAVVAGGLAGVVTSIAIGLLQINADDFRAVQQNRVSTYAAFLEASTAALDSGSWILSVDAQYASADAKVRYPTAGDATQVKAMRDAAANVNKNWYALSLYTQYQSKLWTMATRLNRYFTQEAERAEKLSAIPADSSERRAAEEDFKARHNYIPYGNEDEKHLPDGESGYETWPPNTLFDLGKLMRKETGSDRTCSMPSWSPFC